MAREHAIRGEGFLRPEVGETYFVADVAQAPYFREQQWPDGAPSPNLFRFGSGNAAPHVEMRGWVLGAQGQWKSVVLDGELRKFAGLLACADTGAVIKITRVDGAHPRNKAWRLAKYDFTVAGSVDVHSLPQGPWASPKGLTQAQLAQSSPPTSPSFAPPAPPSFAPPAPPSFAPPQVAPSFAPPQVAPSFAPPQVAPSFAPPQVAPSFAPPPTPPSFAPPQVAPFMKPPF
jgi:hypothetical protein